MVELVEEQEVYEINFNRSRSQVSVADDTDDVSIAVMTSRGRLLARSIAAGWFSDVN